MEIKFKIEKRNKRRAESNEINIAKSIQQKLFIKR